METCLVFPRLICKSQWGVGVPAFSGHRFKNLHILICLYDNLCEIPEDNGRTMAVFVEHAPDVWNMCLGCEVNSSQVVCPTGSPALRGPPCVL